MKPKERFLWAMYGLCAGFLVLGFILIFKDWSWVQTVDNALFSLVTSSKGELNDVAKPLLNSLLGSVFAVVCAFLISGRRGHYIRELFRHLRRSNDYGDKEKIVAIVLFCVLAALIVVGGLLFIVLSVLQVSHTPVLQLCCYIAAALVLNHFVRSAPRYESE